MKIFNWMRNKLNGKENNINPLEPISPNKKEFTNFPSFNCVLHIDEDKSCKEEFKDWPNTLLAIGTFGNSNLKEREKSKIQGNKPAKQDPLENATSEEYAEIDKVLRQLVHKNDSTFSGEPEKLNILTDKLLDSVRKDGLINYEVGNKDVHLQRTTSLVHRGGGDDMFMDKKNSSIGKRSFTFLLKKVFLCSDGFGPGPMLSGPLPFPEPKLDKSRMEKIIRAMLHKKIYPQRPNPNATTKKYLDKLETDSDEEEYNENHAKNIWDKTDSEYIVLEI